MSDDDDTVILERIDYLGEPLNMSPGDYRSLMSILGLYAEQIRALRVRVETLERRTADGYRCDACNVTYVQPCAIHRVGRCARCGMPATTLTGPKTMQVCPECAADLEDEYRQAVAQ